MECFKVIGYYICELCDTPEWLQGISRQILSVSGCIGELHPTGGMDSIKDRSICVSSIF